MDAPQVPVPVVAEQRFNLDIQMSASSKELIIVFVKNAEQGKVKTRLAASVGNVMAFEIYRKLLHHTLAITSPLECDKAIFYSDLIPSNDEWKINNYTQLLQTGKDLGEKMLNAFEYAFQQKYSNIVIIGSDCYELSSDLLRQAFDRLNDYDVVIGPARDGGYYLLGMKQLHSALFQNKQWSTSSVFQTTIDDFNEFRLSYFQLPVLSDIDEEQDLPTELRNLEKATAQ